MAITDQVFHTVLRVHAAIYKSTDGRVGHKLLGVPTLLLRTTGRRSGQTRTNALVYAPDGERWLVVPSNGGADKPPGWLHNLRETPSVEVQIGRRKIPAKATIIEPGDPEFPRLWKAVNDNNGDRYDAYQAKTKRAIPVVALAAS
jgi:deazaflavin-dependent oxidoreductase (nitroreductase family)